MFTICAMHIWKQVDRKWPRNWNWVLANINNGLPNDCVFYEWTKRMENAKSFQFSWFVVAQKVTNHLYPRWWYQMAMLLFIFLNFCSSYCNSTQILWKRKCCNKKIPTCINCSGPMSKDQDRFTFIFCFFSLKRSILLRLAVNWAHFSFVSLEFP